MTRQYFNGCHGAIAVFDLTSKETLEHLESQLVNFRNHCPAHVVNNVVLVGSKVDDLQNRAVSQKVAEEFCVQTKCLAFFETSARESINIDDAFFTVALQANLMLS